MRKAIAILLLLIGSIGAMQAQNNSFQRVQLPRLKNSILGTDADGNVRDTIIAGSSGLEKVTENGKTGWRLKGANPANYGDIGKNAVDLSYSPSTSTAFGARGGSSTAMGSSTIASGNLSTAMGSSTIASGGTSTAMGAMTIASRYYSTAMGYGTAASGNSSTAMGSSTIASGNRSTAMGSSTAARGSTSTAMGSSTIASGEYSTAMGYGTAASGNSSTAMGAMTIASGNRSTAMGSDTRAYSFAETAMGTFTTEYTPQSTYNFKAADRLLVVGNGADNTNKSNALIILKSGLTTLPSQTIAMAEAETSGRVVVTKEFLEDRLSGLSGGGGTPITETDPTVPAHVKSISTANIASWNSDADTPADWNATTGAARILNKPNIPPAATGAETKINAGTNVSISGQGTSTSPYVINATGGGGGGGITTETDPTVPAHVKSISTTNINKWNGAITRVSAGGGLTGGGSSGAVSLALANDYSQPNQKQPIDTSNIAFPVDNHGWRMATTSNVNTLLAKYGKALLIAGMPAGAGSIGLPALSHDTKRLRQLKLVVYNSHASAKSFTVPSAWTVTKGEVHSISLAPNDFFVAEIDIYPVPPIANSFLTHDFITVEYKVFHSDSSME